MPNQVHLREPNLRNAMHLLHGRYVRWFNDRHGRVGRLFEDRYKAKLVADELYFLTVVRYIEMNPVDAALCARPEAYRWSSRGLIATGNPPGWLADDVLQARRAEFTT